MLYAYTWIRVSNEIAIPSKGNVVSRHRIFSPVSGPSSWLGHQRTAQVTPISPSMPIYADVYLTRYEGGGLAITATGDKRYARTTPRSIYVNTSGDLAYTS